MAQGVHKLKTLFITYGGAHYKLFNILHSNFDNTSIMDARFRKDFEKHFRHLVKIDLQFCDSKISLLRKARKYVKAKDIIIANCPISGAIARIACLFNRKKRVFLMCQDFYEYFDVGEKHFLRRIIYGPLLKLMIRLSCTGSLVIALSNHIKQRAEVYGAKNVKIIPVYGIDMSIFKPKKSAVYFNTNKRIILTTARFAPEKGLQYILNAVAQLPNVHLVMVGPGNSIELKALIRQMGLTERVDIIGEVDPIKIADYYNACDIFVLPSLREGLGFSSAEAMACKKPVIASNTGGIPEIVINNKTGILVEPGNAEEIRAAIQRLMTSKELQKKLAEAGYRHVKLNYQEKDITKKFVKELVNY